jgi:hypothetical protein
MKDIGASSAGYHFFSDFYRCQKYWYWKYVEKLLPINEATALTNGKAFHDAMEQYYKTIQSNIGSVEACLNACISLNNASIALEDREKLKAALSMYAAHYAFEPWTILEVEENYEHLFKINNAEIYFTGRIDLVVQWLGKVFIVDHKTTRWIINKVAEANALSDQSTGYIALWNAKHPDMPAAGMIYNIIKLENKTDGFIPAKDLHREIVYKNQTDIDNFFLDLHTASLEIKRKLAGERFTKNRTACFNYNAKCDYCDLCAGADPSKLIGITYKVGDNQ